MSAYCVYHATSAFCRSAQGEKIKILKEHKDVLHVVKYISDVLFVFTNHEIMCCKCKFSYNIAEWIAIAVSGIFICIPLTITCAPFWISYEISVYGVLVNTDPCCDPQPSRVVKNWLRVREGILNGIYSVVTVFGLFGFYSPAALGVGTTDPLSAMYENAAGRACVVCLDDTYDPFDTVQRLSCGHCFHAQCIKEWLQYSQPNPTCPICRHVPIHSTS
jgi:hypothetical protein